MKSLITLFQVKYQMSVDKDNPKKGDGDEIKYTATLTIGKET